MYHINPYSRTISLKDFTRAYFKGASVPDKIARSFYSDFRLAFIGSLDKYIRETSEEIL